MKFKVDHNLPVEAAEALRAAGHDAVTAEEQGMATAEDEVIAAHCRNESRCIVTLDTDFGNIRAYPPPDYAGIIVLRPLRQDKKSVLNLLRASADQLRVESPAGRLWIVEPDRIRIHDGG